MRMLLSTLFVSAAIGVDAQTDSLPYVFAAPDGISRGLGEISTVEGFDTFPRRTTRVDLGELAVAKTGVRQSGSAHIGLNLFDGVELEGMVERVRATSAGYALSGRIVGRAWGSFTIVVNGDVVAGDVRESGSVYRLYGRGGTVHIQQVDPALLRECEGGRIPPVGQAPPGRPPAADSLSEPFSGATSGAMQDDDSVIDVFVFYTVSTRKLAGGHDLMRANIDLDVAWTNDAYALSGVTQRINLVGIAETEDILPLRGSQLWWLTYRIPHVRAIRDAYAADLVAVKDGRGGGLAWISMLNPWPAHLAFSVVGLYPPDTFAHELGHNMGLRHPRNGLNPDVENTPYPYSHGYVLPGLPSYSDTGLGNFTIMDGRGPPGLQRFSSPRLNHKGVPLGVPGDEPSFHADGPADAVRSLENTRVEVANFRSRADRCHYRLTPGSAEIPVGGGSFTVEVETGDDCNWSAKSHDSVLAVESGAEGVGNGRVTYRVAANGGWERVAALRIAGETFLVRQGSDRVPLPVCDRSPAVQDAIESALDKSCEDIDAADLNRIARLIITSETVPVEGDLDGMTNLGDLHIHWSEDSPLPVSIFDGLSNVVELLVAGAGLEAGALDALQSLNKLQLNGGNKLPSGLFAEMSNISRLNLYDYDLASLPFGSFHGLTGVDDLHLLGSRLGQIERGAFEGLDQLTKLRLKGNEIESLRPGAFQGLSRLRSLSLDDNKLTRLAAGTFDGLSQVEFLNLNDNMLLEVERETFRGLSGIEYLYLSNNRLKTLPVGIFSGLTTLRWRLDLSNNPLERLEPGIFAGLGNLRALMLGQADLKDLPLGTFSGLTSLIVLDLHANKLEQLQAGVFGGLVELAEIRLHENRLQKLPAGIFAGLLRLNAVTLRDNPGTPFMFVLDLGRGPLYGNRTESVALRVLQGAPFAMMASLSVENGYAAVNEVSISAGQTEGAGVSIMPAGDDTVTVSLASAPQNPTVLGCEETHKKPCYPGVRIVAGEPISLYGLPDQTLSNDEPARFDLIDVFGVFFDSHALSFAVTSSQPGIVETVVTDRYLTLTTGEAGTAIVTVVATDGQTSVTRRFTVTVPETLRTFWHGWRLRVLTQQSDDN